MHCFRLSCGDAALGAGFASADCSDCFVSLQAAEEAQRTPHRPKLNPRSSAYVPANGSGPQAASDRLYKQAQSQAAQRSLLQKAKELTDARFDPETGVEMFKPAINRKSAALMAAKRQGTVDGRVNSGKGSSVRSSSVSGTRSVSSSVASSRDSQREFSGMHDPRHHKPFTGAGSLDLSDDDAWTGDVAEAYDDIDEEYYQQLVASNGGVLDVRTAPSRQLR